MSLNGTSLFELRYDESEHSVRCILNIEETFQKYQTKDDILSILFFRLKVQFHTIFELSRI